MQQAQPIPLGQKNRWGASLLLFKQSDISLYLLRFCIISLLSFSLSLSLTLTHSLSHTHTHQHKHILSAAEGAHSFLDV